MKGGCAAGTGGRNRTRNKHSTMMKPFQLVSDSDEEGEGDTVDQQISEAEKKVAQLEWELECIEDATWEVARANNPGKEVVVVGHNQMRARYLELERAEMNF
jgi:hypothetical protein